MSRTILVALLFALLCLTFSNFASAACSNSCSNNGACVSASWCNCTVGYVGLDCSVKTSMTPQCWIGGNVCSQWGVQDGSIYQRVWATNTTSAGWVAVMWGSTDGMSGGQSTIFTLQSNTISAFDGYNSKKGRPTNTTGQSVGRNVTGGASGNGLDISFSRLLDTGLAQHYVIPAAKGTASTFSVAYAQSFFEFHQDNAQFVKSIDIVGVVSVAETEQASYAQNRHSKMAGFMTPQ